tara:strand:- start:517 stop:891 length:375 start_codon:yes stop_codon:yes gene_type:complete
VNSHRAITDAPVSTGDPIMHRSDATEPITSSFADDAEMVELIEIFVSELPDRMQAVSNAYTAQNWDTLRTLAHQLKGAAPGYGFEPVGAAAADLEQLLKDGLAADDLSDAVESLLAICKRVAVE